MTNRKPFFTIAAFILICLVSMIRASLQPLPSLMHHDLVLEWGIHSEVAFGNLVSSYFYIYLIMQIPAAIIYERVDIRKVFVPIAILMGLSTILFAYSPNIWIAGVARIIEGISSAFVIIGALSYITNNFSDKMFVILFGVFDFIGLAGSATIQQVYIYAINSYGWKNMVIILGVVIVLLSILCYLLISLANNKNLANKTNENKATFSFLQFKQVLTNKKVIMPVVYFFFVYSILNVFANAWATPFIQETYRKQLSLNITNSESVFLSMAVSYGLAIGYIIIPQLAKIVKKDVLFIRITSILSILFLVVFIFYMAKPHYYVLVISLFIVSVLSSSTVIGFGLVKKGARKGNKIIAVAIMNIAGGLSPIVLQPIFSSILDKTSEGAKTLSILNFQYAMIFIFFCCLIATICLFFIKNEHYKVVDSELN